MINQQQSFDIVSSEVSIHPEIYKTTLLQLVEKFQVSVRLENCIKNSYATNELPFLTVGEYLNAGNTAFDKLMSVKNLGRKTAQELNQLILKFVDSPSSLTSDRFSCQTSSSSAKIGIKETQGYYQPDPIFDTKATSIDSIFEALNEKQEKILKLRYGFEENGVLTLEQIGNIFDVTRERIRQIESKSLNQLRKLFGNWAKQQLDSQNIDIWSILTQNTLVLPSNLQYSPRKFLSSTQNLLIDIAYGNAEQWLNSISKKSPFGRISISEDFERLNNIVSEINNAIKSQPLPVHSKVFESKFKISIHDQILVASLKRGINLFGSYLINKPLGKRLKRMIRTHALLYSMAAHMSLPMNEIRLNYINIFPDDVCSNRDLLIVMTAAPHLFLNCYEEGWAALGVSEKIENLLNSVDSVSEIEDIEKEEESFSNIFESATQILIDILKNYGPQQFDVIREKFVELAKGRYSKSSVGPLLITREDFIRLAPGVYGLTDHLKDETAINNAQNILLDRRHAELYCHAKAAGEGFGWFPLWTPTMEYLWNEWARHSTEILLFQSLLKVSEPSTWSIPEKAKGFWIALKEKQGNYHLLENNPLDLTETLPSIRNIAAAAVVAKNNGYLNWMSANRAMGLRIDDRHAHTSLAILISLGILKPTSHWQLRHLFNAESSYLIDQIQLCLSLSESCKNLISKAIIVESQEIGWTNQSDLNNLMLKWVGKLGGDQNISDQPQEVSFKTLDDLINLVQKKKNEDIIYG